MSSKRLFSFISFHTIPPIKRCLQLPRPTRTHSYIPSTRKDAFILATRIKSYFEKGLITEAHNLFHEIPERDVVEWTAMIAGYTSSTQYTHAWTMFCNMVHTELEPNAFTISSVLKACKGMKGLSCGVSVHGFAVKRGLQGYIYVDNTLMDMYATCGKMKDACRIFQGIEEKNAVSWTTLITGYTHRGCGHGALQIFREMLLEEAETSPFIFSIAVRACASIGSDNYGKQIHAAVIKHGFESNLPVMNSILDMYCRCGCLPEANQYFYEMTKKDMITWNTLIAGYERMDSSDSLLLFSKMESEGFTPNCFTFSSVITACANLGALSYGQQVHGGIVHRGLNGDLEVANTLINMYAKCGNIIDSHNVFSEMSRRNLFTWTLMLIGYGAHGYGKDAIDLFNEMVRSGIRPDRIVFTAVLSACSHAGLLDHGLRYFNSMIHDYKIEPDQEIYGCVVNLLGRAGRVEEAYQLIESMPFNPDEAVWHALLGACKAHNHPKLIKRIARRVLKMGPKSLVTYVMLSNIYAAEGKWGEVARIKKLIKGLGSKKETGRSWIEVKE